MLPPSDGVAVVAGFGILLDFGVLLKKLKSVFCFPDCILKSESM